MQTFQQEKVISQGLTNCRHGYKTCVHENIHLATAQQKTSNTRINMDISSPSVFHTAVDEERYFLNTFDVMSMNVTEGHKLGFQETIEWLGEGQLGLGEGAQME